jgi:hypothetical protein
VAREDDSDPRAIRVGSSIYRCVLRLYPHAFEARFAEELEDDFLSMSQDAWRDGGAAALCRWWMDAAIDVVRSLGREWVRTPWIPIGIVSALVAAGVFWAAMGRAQLPLRVFRSKAVSNAPPPPESAALVLLMGLMVLIPVAAIAVIWFVARLVRHEPPRRRMS